MPPEKERQVSADRVAVMLVKTLMLGAAIALAVIGPAYAASNLPQLPLGRWQDSNGSNLILKKDGYFFAEDCKIIKAKAEPSSRCVRHDP